MRNDFSQLPSYRDAAFCELGVYKVSTFLREVLILSLSKPGDLLDNNMAIMMAAALNFQVETV